MLPRPYYEADGVTLYHGDCREILPGLRGIGALVSDPPYPNNAGHFLDGIEAARSILSAPPAPVVLAFWSELEPPPVPLPLVAVHIWHRANVNGRPYEPIFHFAANGEKRRSEVLRHAAIFDGAGPGCHEYEGHPTQKPVAPVLRRRRHAHRRPQPRPPRRRHRDQRRLLRRHRPPSVAARP